MGVYSLRNFKWDLQRKDSQKRSSLPDGQLEAGGTVHSGSEKRKTSPSFPIFTTGPETLLKAVAFCLDHGFDLLRRNDLVHSEDPQVYKNAHLGSQKREFRFTPLEGLYATYKSDFVGSKEDHRP